MSSRGIGFQPVESTPFFFGPRAKNQMSRQESSVLPFSLSLVAIPAFVHMFRAGLYKSDIFGGTFGVGPVSTTIPYVCLAVLFVAHCFDLGSRPRRQAYVTASIAWLCMMAFTVFLVSQSRVQGITSTSGMAMIMTPFFFIPFLLVPYLVVSIINTLVAGIANRRK